MPKPTKPTLFAQEFTVILRLRKAKSRRWSLEAMRQYLGTLLDEVTVEEIHPERLLPTQEELDRDYPKARPRPMISAAGLERCGVPPAEAKRRAKRG